VEGLLRPYPGGPQRAGGIGEGGPGPLRVFSGWQQARRQHGWQMERGPNRYDFARGN